MMAIGPTFTIPFDEAIVISSVKQPIRYYAEAGGLLRAETGAGQSRAPMDPLADDALKKITSAVLSTTNSANRLSSKDLDFQNTFDPKFAEALNEQNGRLLALANKLLLSASAGTDLACPKLRDPDDIETNWSGVVDVIDSLFERADRSLDRVTGFAKQLNLELGEGSTNNASQDPSSRYRKTELWRNLELPKPQLLFENAPQNNVSGPFKPLLTSKPNAIVPLADSLVLEPDDDGNLRYPNPYATEIQIYQFPETVTSVADPVPFAPFEKTSAIFVDTLPAVLEMLAELKNAKEIAVDLEHHESRSYIGLVSLMQISTRDKDWIVDTLKPWRRKLECLNEVFCDPRILKVLHGAIMDVIWLQRDLGIYVVGLFDTFVATRALAYQRGSLAILLKKFANVTAQKQHQLSDWRIRPLPPALFDYARSDTHYLLNIYDNLRNELVNHIDPFAPGTDAFELVLSQSKEVCLQRYEHSPYDESGDSSAGWRKPLLKTKEDFSNEQISVFRALHKWRDEQARLEDESPNYVIPINALVNIARSLPANKKSLFALSHNVSKFFRSKTDEILAEIANAKANVTPNQRLHETALFNSVSAVTLPGAANSKNLTDICEKDLRTTDSSLWGKYSTSVSQSATPQHEPSPAPMVARLALPLPPLTASIYATDDLSGAAAAASASMPPPSEPGSRATHEYVKQAQRTPAPPPPAKVFTVKALGGGRKRKRAPPTNATTNTDSESATNDVSAAESAPTSLPPTPSPAADSPDPPADGLDPDSQAKLRKELKRQERKRRRKEHQREQKNLQRQRLEEGKEGAAASAEASADAESLPPSPSKPAQPPATAAEPFDYASAPSVLNPPRGPKSAAKSKKAAAAAAAANSFYARPDAAAPGLGRARKEKPGKSMTFKK